MSNHDYDDGPIAIHHDLEALMARGRRMRSEAFINGVSTLFHAPGNALTKASSKHAGKSFVHGARKGHA